MRTTIDLPEAVWKKARKRAAERHTTLRELVLRSLRRELETTTARAPAKARRIDWEKIVVKGGGGLLPGADPADRRTIYSASDRPF